MNADPDFADNVILPMIKEAGRWAGELIVKLIRTAEHSRYGSRRLVEMRTIIQSP
jgi:hypothetical protein